MFVLQQACDISHLRESSAVVGEQRRVQLHMSVYGNFRSLHGSKNPKSQGVRVVVFVDRNQHSRGQASSQPGKWMFCCRPCWRSACLLKLTSRRITSMHVRAIDGSAPMSRSPIRSLSVLRNSGAIRWTTQEASVSPPLC